MSFALITNPSPIADNETFGWGRVSEGSGIYFVFVSILSKPILLSLMTCYLVSFCIVVCFVCEAVSLFLKS